MRWRSHAPTLSDSLGAASKNSRIIVAWLFKQFSDSFFIFHLKGGEVIDNSPPPTHQYPSIVLPPCGTWRGHPDGSIKLLLRRSKSSGCANGTGTQWNSHRMQGFVCGDVIKQAGTRVRDLQGPVRVRNVPDNGMSPGNRLPRTENCHRRYI